MRRILVVHCPMARSTAGNSFGPITISATTAMTINSPHAMSNIALQLRTPPLPLGDRVYGNLAPREKATPSGDGGRRPLLPSPIAGKVGRGVPHDAWLFAPAADESAV